MGMFWGGNSDKNDPTKSLDDDLKQFLKEQQPRAYVPAEAPSKEPEEKKNEPVARLPDTNKTYEDRPLPKESLFQDGRYKDIWKTYIPQNEIAAATSTPVERLTSNRKTRRASIHKAALENCAFEEEMKQNCFHNGDVMNRARARMTMCREETKAFNRCYQLQAKFLQALGYVSNPSNSDQDDERIQMHADSLYHRMMDYEAEAEDARRNNKPVPPLTSLFNPDKPAPTIEEINLPITMQEKMKVPLQDLPPHERELAARAALQEAKVRATRAEDLLRYSTVMDEEKKGRQAFLTKVFGEAIGKFFIPDSSPPDIKSYRPEQLERSFWDDPSMKKQNPDQSQQNKK